MIPIISNGILRSLPFRGLRFRAVVGRSLFSSSRKSNVVESLSHGECLMPQIPLVERFFQVTDLWPRKIAIECAITGRHYTYAELGDLTRRFSSSLARMGFQAGDVLALALPNAIEFPVLFFGAAANGMPVSLVNAASTCEEMTRLVNDCGAVAVVGDPTMANMLRRVSPLCPKVRRLILMGRAPEGFTSVSPMLHDEGDLFDGNYQADLDSDMLVLPSCMSRRGSLKSAVLTNTNVSVNIQQMLFPGTCGLRCATDDHQDVHLCVLPFTHVYGLFQLLLGFETAAKMVVLSEFKALSFINAINSFKPTALQLVAPLVSILALYPALNPKSFDRTHTIFSVGCGGPINIITTSKLLDRINSPQLSLHQVYGMAETCLATHVSSVNSSKMASIGRPLSRTRAKIVDTLTGEALAANRQGELCVAGPQVMRNYLDDIEATSEVLDPDGWFHTGDLAYYDDNEDFFIVHRLAKPHKCFSEDEKGLKGE